MKIEEFLTRWTTVGCVLIVVGFVFIMAGVWLIIDVYNWYYQNK